ncbi:MAG: glycoside hydrolase family 30 protein [Bacteroidia bacterium]|nr:glycoside hydrolase family 30 protein [Bacteroidia bacterium]
MAFCACKQTANDSLSVDIFQTSSSGDKLTQKQRHKVEAPDVTISIRPTDQFQTITGFGGAFTESSAYVLDKLPDSVRTGVINSYFGDEGAQYSLTRTHMNSCDFSIDHYSYAPVKDDTALEHFTIEPDLDDLVPMIKDAQATSSQGFKIVASPWTAPPWMKDNNHWYGGKLLNQYYSTWARFFVKYQEAYAAHGIPIWAFTVENEPLGNNSNWESMHYTPEEMARFVTEYLGPELKKTQTDTKLLVYDQNRGKELDEWAGKLLTDTALLPHIYGTAVHWYTSTYDYFGASLTRTHDLAPEKHLLHTEGCIDAEVPKWNNDAWYWSKEATDWGWDWATEEDKVYHPKYIPAYRYARDIIGCLNNWVEGWIDWNMVLDRQGGPNLANNWCVAPVIADTATGEVYYTPLYYIISHFSKFIRPGAIRIGHEVSTTEIMTTSVSNPDGSIVTVLFNPTSEEKTIEIKIDDEIIGTTISKEAVQTLILRP